VLWRLPRDGQKPAPKTHRASVFGGWTKVSVRVAAPTGRALQLLGSGADGGFAETGALDV
jgi:hypothetical protein